MQRSRRARAMGAGCATVMHPAGAFAFLCVHALLATTGVAQSISVTAISVNIATEAVGQLYGVRIGADMPTPAPAISIRLSLETARSTRALFAPLCVGLILNPAECNPRAIHRTASAAGVMGGVGIKIVSTPRGALNVNLGIGALREKTRSRGDSGNNELSDDQGIWRAELGVDAHWFPLARIPLGVVLEAAYGTQQQFVDQGIVDGYSPLLGRAHVTQLRAGVLWRLPKQ